MSAAMKNGGYASHAGRQTANSGASPQDENRSSASELDRQSELEYALGWFTYHAGQRLAAFNFFLIIVGVVVVGYAQALVYGLWYIALALSLYGDLVSFAFWCLEIRNKELVNIGRAALDAIESGSHGIAIRREDRERVRLQESLGLLSRVLFLRYAPLVSETPRKRIRRALLLSHGFWFRTIIWITFVGFAAAALYAALRFTWWWPLP
jgi:hypothetical protein